MPGAPPRDNMVITTTPPEETEEPQIPLVTVSVHAAHEFEHPWDLYRAWDDKACQKVTKASACKHYVCGSLLKEQNHVYCCMHIADMPVCTLILT